MSQRSITATHAVKNIIFMSKNLKFKIKRKFVVSKNVITIVSYEIIDHFALSLYIPVQNARCQFNDG